MRYAVMCLSSSARLAEASSGKATSCRANLSGMEVNKPEWSTTPTSCTPGSNWFWKKRLACPEKKVATSSPITPSAGKSKVVKIKPPRRTLTRYSCHAMIRMLFMVGPLAGDDLDKNLVERHRGQLELIHEEALVEEFLQKSVRRGGRAEIDEQLAVAR